MSGTEPVPAGGAEVIDGPGSWSRWPFRKMAIVLAVTAFGAGIPTPLYSIYEKQFDFSSVILAGIFATYTVGVVVTMFLLAPQADKVGTHPVLYVGMALTALSGLTFILAGGYLISGGVLWLALSRLLSGLGVGATTSTATLSMTKKEPRADKHHVARVAVAANFGGVSTGVLLSALMVAFVPHPTLIPYLVLIASAGAGIVLLKVTPPHVHHGLHFERVGAVTIGVPRSIRGPFWVAVAGIVACYSIYGFFASLAPTAVRLATHLPASEAAAFVAVMFASAAGIQALLGEVEDRVALLIGFPLMATGLVLFILSLPTGSVLLSIVSAVVLGVAVGYVYMGSIMVADRIAPDSLRGEVLSGFHLAGYLAVAVPTITLAFIALQIGVVDSGLVFGSVLAVAVVLTYLETRRVPLPPGGEGHPLHPRESSLWYHL
jgi:MFS family permease